MTIVRYGLFYGAYKDESYYWELVITFRKISIIALSVFGPAMGTERQTQMVLAVLFICISLEIAGDPYKLVDESFRILGRHVSQHCHCSSERLGSSGGSTCT